MKQTDNRQNKWSQFRAEKQRVPKEQDYHLISGQAPGGEIKDLSVSRGGSVYGLVSNLFLATKIAQASKFCHLSVHNMDKAGAVLEHMKEKMPRLVILDWDGCEAEAFKYLKEIRANADLKEVAVIGWVSNAKQGLKEEAQRAGCHRVYSKTEFTRDLNEILARYAR